MLSYSYKPSSKYHFKPFQYYHFAWTIKSHSAISVIHCTMDVSNWIHVLKYMACTNFNWSHVSSFEESREQFCGVTWAVLRSHVSSFGSHVSSFEQPRGELKLWTFWCCCCVSFCLFVVEKVSPFASSIGLTQKKTSTFLSILDRVTGGSSFIVVILSFSVFWIVVVFVLDVCL